jgi:hypothetical protein
MRHCIIPCMYDCVTFVSNTKTDVHVLLDFNAKDSIRLDFRTYRG